MIPTSRGPRRSLAGTSVGVDPMDAYEGAQELVEAVRSMEGGNGLARILGRRGNDLMRKPGVTHRTWRPGDRLPDAQGRALLPPPALDAIGSAAA